MIRFRMCENYIQYVDGMADGDRHRLEQNRIVDGCTYHLCSVCRPELFITYRSHRIALYLPGWKKQKDNDNIYFNKADKDKVIKLFDVYKDMLQLEGADRWIL